MNTARPFGAAVAALVLVACSAQVVGPPASPTLTPPSRQAAAVPPDEWPNARNQPDRSVALLLPLTGPFATAAEEVQDGFLGEYFRAESSFPVTVYDTTGTEDGARDAWERALADGAGLVVGPLTKGGVRALDAASGESLPRIVLNYADVTRPNELQMGLAPEDEAREAARSARAAGAGRAAILVPGTPWGERLGQAFADAFVAAGGTVQDRGTFEEDAHDYSDAIRTLFGLADSESRHRRLIAALGRPAKFEPRSRQDIEVVFIAATADTGRLLVPQLRFHRVSGIPIYATAAVSDGEIRSPYRDGLRFCGAPVALEDAGPMAELRERLERAFHPANAEALQMLALGHDAFQVARLALDGALTAESVVIGATGTLIVAGDGVLTRHLSCAEIERGRLVRLVAGRESQDAGRDPSVAAGSCSSGSCSTRR